MATFPSRAGGGVLLALGAVLGAIVGVMLGQPTLGMLAGLAIGAAVALIMWWGSRR